MTLIRPEAREALRKGQDLIVAGGLAILGLWLAWLGGYLLLPLGVAIVILSLILARMAWARMRFSQTVLTPGVVELDEAQVGYLGPTEGGFLSLEELVELRLMAMQGRRMWRLKQADGQALLIPVDAKGAERLFDAFAALPGMELGALMRALDVAPGGSAGAAAAPNLSETLVVWRRPAQARLAIGPRGPS